MGLTTDQNSPERINERTAPCDSHQARQDSICYFICVETIISFVDLLKMDTGRIWEIKGEILSKYLDQPTDDSTGKSTSSSSHSHHQSYAAHHRM